MRGDILEFVRLLFVPDNLVIMMQLFRCPLAVKRFIITRQNHQATIAILFAEVGHTLSGNIGILFRAINLAFHVLIREQIRVEDHLADIAKKTNPFRPVSAQTNAANQRTLVDVQLQHFVHFFEQMLHIMFRMPRTVAYQAYIRVNKLQL